MLTGDDGDLVRPAVRREGLDDPGPEPPAPPDPAPAPAPPAGLQIRLLRTRAPGPAAAPAPRQVRVAARGPRPPRRARVREAMRCPFCRDDVARAGAVGCARRGCGALYHAECWEECAASYGGCAVFGCGCEEATGVTRTALLVRALRLLVAAALFPPRMLEALRQEGEGVAAVHRALREDADRAHHLMWDPDRPGARSSRARFWMFASKLLMLALAYGLVIWAVVTWDLLRGTRGELALLLVVAVPVAFTLAFYFGTWPVALGLHWARAVLEGEFHALARAAGGGGTVLDRMRAPGGKKKG
ncbi:MAG: hypothetical protein M9894_12120 [Planctomycetes bacterium]|nr:hypothetical protein [Planctomycetota bacterium]